MTLQIPFDNSFAALGDGFFTRVHPTPLPDPELLIYNKSLADDLNISGDQGAVDIFAGNQIPQGADPLAQLYAGHQFGTYNPRLGDGRAILLGEVTDKSGTRRDIQLKGAGQTPYSRAGDGRAWLGPVLREYVVSEAMHALGIPTTRALAAVRSPRVIFREGPLPAAVLTRVAASHLRVGSFSVFAYQGDRAALRQLTDYAIARHYPGAQGPLGLLQAVCDAQARLIAAWMAVGFIHGVMNTDNCAISGETIDYGPCAFMDAYHPATAFSAIDRMGRYAYGNQPSIAVWNMAQFATALIQQCDDRQAAADAATQIVHAIPDQIKAATLDRFAAKLGLEAPQPGDQALVDDLLTLMQTQRADFTTVFDALTHGDVTQAFSDPAPVAAWHARWQARLRQGADGGAGAKALMQRSNPRVIPRNHQIEAMIAAALQGDYAPLHRLMAALGSPFACTDPALRQPPTPAEEVQATFCGT